MKMNNEVIWQTAENLAKLINEAYTNIKKNEPKWEGEIADGRIKELKGKCTKKQFIKICTGFSMFMHKGNDLRLIVRNVLDLQQESIAEDPDVSYEMFMTCLKFHLAIFERGWKENAQLYENK